jgi:hypothetical protein
MSKLRRPPDSRTILIGALILLNVMMLSAGVKVLLDGRRFLATAAEARGVVVDVAKVREYDSDAGAGRQVTRLYPVVEFVTAREQVVRYQPPMGSNPPDYRVGGPLMVLYDPTNPQHVVLDTWDELWKEGVILLAVGLALTVISVAVYLVLRSDRAARWLNRRSPGGRDPHVRRRRGHGRDRGARPMFALRVWHNHRILSSRCWRGPAALANEASGHRGRASPSGGACDHRRHGGARLALAGRALRVPVAPASCGHSRTTTVGRTPT